MSDTTHMLPVVKEHYGRVRNYIDGELVESSSKRDGEVVYMLDGQKIARVSNLKGFGREVEFTAEPGDGAELPPGQAGEITLVHQLNDGHIKAWTYNPGQRRVRRNPNFEYDNPVPGWQGLVTIDAVNAPSQTRSVEGSFMRHSSNGNAIAEPSSSANSAVTSASNRYSNCRLL